MSYPTLPLEAIARFVDLVAVNRGALSPEQVASFLDESRVDSPTFDADLTAIEAAARAMDELIGTRRVAGTRLLENIEGEACGPTYEALARVPIEVLDDPSFWNYISVRYFWRFILLREHKTVAKLVAGGPSEPSEDDDVPVQPLRRYFDGNDLYQIPLRMFIRAQSVKKGGDYSLAAAVPSGTDFWRSHIIRVSTSYYPALSRALADTQAHRPLTRDPLRTTAERINRYRANMHPIVLDEAEQTEVVRGFWPRP